MVNPFVIAGLLFNCSWWFTYGWLGGDGSIMACNALGVAVGVTAGLFYFLTLKRSSQAQDGYSGIIPSKSSHSSNNSSSAVTNNNINHKASSSLQPAVSSSSITRRSPTHHGTTQQQVGGDVSSAGDPSSYSSSSSSSSPTTASTAASSPPRTYNSSLAWLLFFTFIVVSPILAVCVLRQPVVLEFLVNALSASVDESGGGGGGGTRAAPGGDPKAASGEAIVSSSSLLASADGVSVLVRLHLGFVCMLGSVLLFASPLTELRQIVRNRFGKRRLPIRPLLPRPAILFFSVTSTLLWAVYGLLVRDRTIVIPNALGLTLNLIQVALFCSSAS